MFDKLMQLFGCRHRNITFPISPKGKGMYVVCTTCGQEFAYNWATMTVGRKIARRASCPVVAAKLAEPSIEALPKLAGNAR